MKLVDILLKKRYKRIAQKTCGKKLNNVYINNKCIFSKMTCIGSNCHFNGMKINGTGIVQIGDNFHSGEDCLIITQNHNFDKGEALPYDNTYIVKNVTIGKNVWLGSRVIILPGTKIGDGVVVQAGSVVCGIIPPLAVIGGHPAKVIKYRNKDHYDKLELEQRYF